MKKLISQWKMWQFIEALLLAGIGVICIVCSFKVKDADTLAKIVGLTAGIILILDGVIHACINTLLKSTDVKFSAEAVAVAELSLGIWLCIKPNEFVDNVVLIACLVICVAGLVYLSNTIYSTVKKSQPVKYLVLEYIAVTLVLAAGTLALIFYPYNDDSGKQLNTKTIVLIIIGAVLIGFAIYEAIATCVIIAKARKAEKAANEATAKKHEAERKAEKKEPKEIEIKDAEVVEEPNEAPEEKPEGGSEETPSEDKAE